VVDVVVLLVVDVVVLARAVRVVRVVVVAEVVVVGVGHRDVAPAPPEGGEVRMAGAPERRGEERQRLGLGPGVVAGVSIGAVAGARLIRSHTNLTSVIEAAAAGRHAGQDDVTLYQSRQLD
jgi:hypothetical protein